MSRLSDDEKRYFTDQISMLKGENERLTKYVEYSKDDKECMQNEIDVLKEKNEALREFYKTVQNEIPAIEYTAAVSKAIDRVKKETP